MLQNAYLLAKIGADTAENEQHFAENLPKIGNYPTGRLTPLRGALRERRRARVLLGAEPGPPPGLNARNPGAGIQA